MKPASHALEHASVQQYCKALRVPVIGANFVPLAEQAVKEKRSQQMAHCRRIRAAQRQRLLDRVLQPLPALLLAPAQ